MREARGASPPAGRLARTHGHPPAPRPSARTHTLSGTRTRAPNHKARPRRDSVRPARRVANEPSPRPLASRPGGAVPTRRAGPFTCACCRRASRSRRPRVGFRPRAQSRRPPPRRQPSPSLRPPLGRRPERGRPLRPPRRDPVLGRAAGRAPRLRALAAPDLARAQQRSCRRSRHSGSVSRRSALLPGFGALAGGGGAEGGPEEQRRRQRLLFLRLPSFLLAPRSTSQQLPNPQSPPSPLPSWTPYLVWRPQRS